MNEIVVPNEMARTLGVTGLELRRWLRAEAVAGHPLLASHGHGARWEFTRIEAERLMMEFRDRSRTKSTTPHPPASKGEKLAPQLSEDPGHRVEGVWLGEDIQTLADLLKPGLSGAVVGINPSPVSVAAGHYYQGNLGQAFFRRLENAGVIDPGDGWEDDRAFNSGLGFTDLVKKPTARADGLTAEDRKHGRELLKKKFERFRISRVIFTFKASAVELLGPFDGHGLRPGRPLAGAEVFVMPGPMAPAPHVNLALGELRDWWSADSDA